MKIEQCGKGQKTLFKVSKNFLGCDKNLNFPICDLDGILADRFVSIFSEKVAGICDNLKENLSSVDRIISLDNIARSSKIFGAFQPVSVSDIENMILRLLSVMFIGPYAYKAR